MPTKKIAMNEDEEILRPKCGIVMPISSIDGCSEQHWSDVLSILNETIEDSGFEPNLVSNADDVGIIQKRIIQNLYENPMVVCDVSGKNPNVMFELGMRLAFDKPTIIIKDDKTSYSFDTSPIEHIAYPRDLRFNKIIEFKKELKEKIIGTAKKAGSDEKFSTFLKHFGQFTVAKLDTKEISKDEYILEEIKELRRTVMNLYKYQQTDRIRFKNNYKNYRDEKHKLLPDDCVERLDKAVKLIIKELKSDNILPENLSADNYIISRILDSKYAPPCFEPGKSECVEMLNEVISNNR